MHAIPQLRSDIEELTTRNQLATMRQSELERNLSLSLQEQQVRTRLTTERRSWAEICFHATTAVCFCPIQLEVTALFFGRNRRDSMNSWRVSYTCTVLGVLIPTPPTDD
jgi:hypothetical protein